MTLLPYESTPNYQKAQFPMVQMVRLGLGSWKLGVFAFTETGTANGE